MNNKINIITIIPARGGSKGIPGKNLMNFCGQPLVAWSIIQAKNSKNVNEVYVSSDCDDILSIADSFKAIPIRRPDEYASDAATSESALIHALDVIEKKKSNKVDLVVYLQPTSPLRDPEDIDNALKTFFDVNADSLFSAAVLDDFCVWKKEGDALTGLSFDPFHRGRRQDKEPMYLETGSIYIFWPKILRQFNNRFGGRIEMFEMSYWKSYEIDTMKDIEICEYFFRKYLLHKY